MSKKIKIGLPEIVSIQDIDKIRYEEGHKLGDNEDCFITRGYFVTVEECEIIYEVLKFDDKYEGQQISSKKASKHFSNLEKAIAIIKGEK